MAVTEEETIELKFPFIELESAVIKIMVSFLDVTTLCRLDAAITNHTLRGHWLNAIKVSSSNALDAWKHHQTLTSLQWLSSRQPRVESVTGDWSNLIKLPSTVVQLLQSICCLPLTHLALQTPTCFSDDDVEFLAAGSFVNLEHLEVTLHQDVIPDRLSHLTKGCPNIRSFIVTGKEGSMSSSEQLRALVEGYPKLTCLDLGTGGRYLCDNDMALIAKNCPMLKKLSIGFPDYVTDIGLLRLGDCQLVEVTIEHPLVDVSAKGIVALIQKLPQLRSLTANLSGGSKSVASIIVALTTGCQNIENVKLDPSGYLDMEDRIETHRCFCAPFPKTLRPFLETCDKLKSLEIKSFFPALYVSRRLKQFFLIEKTDLLELKNCFSNVFIHIERVSTGFEPYYEDYLLSKCWWIREKEIMSGVSK